MKLLGGGAGAAKRAGFRIESLKKISNTLAYRQ